MKGKKASRILWLSGNNLIIQQDSKSLSLCVCYWLEDKTYSEPFFLVHQILNRADPKTPKEKVVKKNYEVLPIKIILMNLETSGSTLIKISRLGD